MNVAKAREHFSGYYEGSLDRGLTEAFERLLQGDAQAAAEYRAFERTMENLKVWGSQPIPARPDLHELISAKVDLAVWKEKQTTRPSVTAWLRGLALVGAASVLFGVLWTQMRPSEPATMAGIAGGPSSVSGVRLRVEEGRVLLSYPGLRGKSVTIRDEAGEVLEQIRLENEEIKDKLIGNASSKARLMSVEVPGDQPVFIAVPGNQRQEATESKGTLKDLGKAFAGFYRTPVVLNVSDPSALVEWRFETDELKAAQDAISVLGYQVELRDSNVLWIQAN